MSAAKLLLTTLRSLRLTTPEPVAPEMTFTVTTTSAGQTLTLNELRTAIGETVNVDWGDGQSNDYSSSGSSGNQHTHQYADAGQD